METFRTTFIREFTANDTKRHFSFPLQVPEETTCLRISLYYSPLLVERIHNLLTLTVFSPSGWRGEGHRGGNRKDVLLAADHASPGFVPGAIEAGAWSVVVNTQLVMPGPECNMRLEVWGTDEPRSEPVCAPTAAKTASRGAGWYRGDLHNHTRHSDGAWEASDLAAFARSKKLDFITLSDHNTISGLAEMAAQGGDDLLIVKGLELTTFWGHALALGTDEALDWRLEPGKRSMEDIAGEVTRRGGLFIIAHPMADGDPKCTGCNWLYSEMMPGAARVVEVWNEDWQASNNEDSLRLAFDWLNLGCRLALTSGSDNHGGRMVRRTFGFDVVFAQDLSEAEILRAVREGHLYLSSGPGLVFSAEAQGVRVGMGDVLALNPDDTLRLETSWEDCPKDARLELILDGKVRETLPARASGAQGWSFQVGASHWGVVALRDAKGSMLALSNPIFWDGRV